MDKTAELEVICDKMFAARYAISTEAGHKLADKLMIRLVQVLTTQTTKAKVDAILAMYEDTPKWYA